MKRSKTVKLAVMGVSPFILTACTEQPTEALVYGNVDQCIVDGKLNAGQCQQEYKTALMEHRKNGPKYTYSYQCESDYGPQRCEKVVHNGLINYVPIMTAFMAPLILQNRSPGYVPSVYAQPLYWSHYNPRSYTTLDHYNIPKTTGKVKTTTKATKKPSLRTRTVSRGGFGSQAAARGGWGSGSRSWGG